MYICIKDVKTLFTLFNAKPRPKRPFTVGRGGYNSVYESNCISLNHLKRPVYRHFRVTDTVIYRIYRKKCRKSTEQKKKKIITTSKSRFSTKYD